MTVTVNGPNGETVNLRTAASRSAARIEKIPSGTEAELLGTDGDWSKIRVNGKTGWMMTEFLVTDESAGDDFDSGDLDSQDGEKVALYFTREELRTMIPVLDGIADRMAEIVGRG